MDEDFFTQDFYDDALYDEPTTAPMTLGEWCSWLFGWLFGKKGEE